MILRDRLIALAAWPLVFIIMLMATTILVVIAVLYPALALAGMVDVNKPSARGEQP